MNTPHRLHSLDNLRASMMWLGIVLHVSVNHLVGESPLPWRDSATSRVADLLLAFIHAFRMPVFFMLAGFFVALLVQRRGWRAMLAHRFKRIALPFLLFWPPIVVVSVVMVMLFVHRMVRGSFGLDPAVMPPGDGRPLLNTMHLWFLYLLWWLVLATALVAWLGRAVPVAWRSVMAQAVTRLGASWWGPLLLCLPLVLAGAPYRHGLVTPLGALLPPPAEWLHNGMFYAFGWFLYQARETLLPLYTRRWARYLLAGLPFFLATGALVELARQPAGLPHEALWVAFSYNLCGWLWSFGLIGLFLRHLPQHRPVLAYLADSAYWVYLVHMPLTIGFGALLYGGTLGALPKMLLNITLTTLVCLLSYQLLVRGRWIGRLLNGSRTDRRTPTPRSLEATA